MSSAGKSMVPLDIVDARSPDCLYKVITDLYPAIHSTANQYLVRLLEDKGTITFQPLTEERIQLVFEVLDKVTPNLGVFSQVIALIRSELHGAVYSQTLPGSRPWIKSEGLIRLPFFSLVRRMQTDRNEDLERVTSELHRVNAIVLEKEEELLSLRKEFSAVQEINKTLRADIAILQMETKEIGMKNSMLEEEVRVQARQLEVERQTQRQYVTDLHNQLRTSHIHVQEMEQLNAAYIALQRAFQVPLTRKKQNMLSLVGKVPADRSGPSSTYVASYLPATKHMSQQLLQVQNSVMDDFDCFLENRIHTSEPEDSHEQLNEETQMFLSRLSEISEELLLLNQQKESLEQRETSSAEVTLTAQNLNTRYPDRSDTDSQKTDDKNIESFLSQALYPDETLLNRYAAMIYTSTDNGRIFQELDGASICNSCGEKTVLCPHKVGGSQVIRLPKDCTHITICRPRAHQTTMEAKIAASRAMSPKSPGNQSAAANSGGRWARHVDFSKLENDFEKQLKLKRDFPRMISLDLCVSLSQRLIVTMIHQLEGTSPILHIQETVLEFFTKRYVNEDISSRGLQDFLTAVVGHSPDSKVLYLLGCVLQRDLDPTVLCYVLLKAEMVSLSPLTDMDQFLVFLHKQYPFLEETERDSLVLEFTAYSRRCVSPPAVMGFILEMILTQQEPLITEYEDVLSTHTKTQPGYLTVEELSEALDELCPLSSKMQTQSLIQRSVALSASSLIPLHKAAQLAAYQLERDRQSGKSGREHEEDDAENKGSKGTEYLKEKSDLQFLYNILHVLRTTGR